MLVFMLAILAMFAVWLCWLCRPAGYADRWLVGYEVYAAWLVILVV
jgi:hypothetical protein